MSLAALDDKFACLDQLPELLYAPVVTHPHGELISRTAGVMQWREALLAGELPDPQALLWPEKTLRMTILMRLEALDICRYCREQEDLADRVLLDILEGIQSAADYYKHKPGGFVDELAQRQNTRDQDSVFEDPDGLADHIPPNPPETNVPDQTRNEPADPAPPQASETANETIPGAAGEPEVNPLDALAADARCAADSVSADAAPTDLDSVAAALDTNEVWAVHIDEFLTDRWRELLTHWQEISELLTEFGGFLSRGWDLTRGTLVDDGWREIIRYRRLIKQAPQLATLVAQLGRSQPTDQSVNDDAADVTTPEVAAASEGHSDPEIPRVKMETGGIERSDELSRLLPGELALLGHPRLNKLWHARRAERLLLTYRFNNQRSETHLIHPLPSNNAVNESERQTPGKGPILVCLDTSGSMHGAPEHIAKAVVLEALRTAFNEQRACHVYSFSGQDDLLQHELDLTRGGLGKLLQFLRHSFHGGTDVTQPLLLALNKQKTTDWKDADILLVSDGRFPLHEHMQTRIQQLKQTQGLRIHGLLLGNWKATALKSVCSPCYRFEDWQLLNQD